MEGIENIFELIILLLIFVFGPLFKRLQRRKQQPSAKTTPAPARRQRPAQARALADYEPSPAPPVVRTPQAVTTTTGAATDLALTQLAEDVAKLQSVRDRIANFRLDDPPNLSRLATTLRRKSRKTLDFGIADLKQAMSRIRSGALRDREELAATDVHSRDLLKSGKQFEKLMQVVSTQRSDPQLQATLPLMDRLARDLASTGLDRGRSRERWAVIWNEHTHQPSLSLGSGGVGVVACSNSHLSTASGWAQLAHGIGYDTLAEAPLLIEEVQKAALIAPLNERTPREPYYATAALDVASAVSSWVPCLLADIFATSLLGPTFPAALVHSEFHSGKPPSNAITIAVSNGLYHHQPPLVLRLKAIETQLQKQGWQKDPQLVTSLVTRLQLPPEMRYGIRSYQGQRFHLTPFLDLLASITESVLDARYDALSQRQLTDVFSSKLRGVAYDQLAESAKNLLAGKRIDASPAHILATAVHAETSSGQHRISLIQEMMAALRRIEIVAASKTMAKTKGHQRLQNADDLFRDALVLSEIL